MLALTHSIENSTSLGNLLHKHTISIKYHEFEALVRGVIRVARRFRNCGWLAVCPPCCLYPTKVPVSITDVPPERMSGGSRALSPPLLVAKLSRLGQPLGQQQTHRQL